MRALLAIACAACGVDGPSVRLHLVQPGVAPEVSEFAWAGAMAWSTAGVDFTTFDPADQDAYGDSRTECPRPYWLADPTPACVITVHATFIPMSELGGALGVAYPAAQAIEVGFELRGFELEAVVAHEVGHVIFQRYDHIEADGIMHATFQGFVQPTAADLQWAATAPAAPAGSGEGTS